MKRNATVKQIISICKANIIVMKHADNIVQLQIDGNLTGNTMLNPLNSNSATNREIDAQLFQLMPQKRRNVKEHISLKANEVYKHLIFLSFLVYCSACDNRQKKKALER